jgi:hypothetical protein
MRFGLREEQFNKKLDENFGKTLSSFIIRYRLVIILCQIKRDIMQKIGVCIYAREKHWTANGSHAKQSW